MGGDCLNYGCVPSKSLIASAKHAHAMTTGAPFGITPVEPQIDYAAAKDHVRRVIDTIAPVDSQERFEALGVRVLRAYARFVSDREVEAGGDTVRARRFVIATGSSPLVPPIPGLDAVEALTNETIFELRERPEHLLIVGGGPIGMEMAQAHRRLGCEVTVVEGGRALGKDDPELAAVVIERLREEGVRIEEGTKVARVSKAGSNGAQRITVRRRGRARVHGHAPPARRGAARQRRPAQPGGGGDRLHAPRPHGGRRPAHHEQARLRRGRRRGPAPVHPRGRLPCRRGDPCDRAGPARQGASGPHPLGHLHRPRASPGGPHGGAGARAARRPLGGRAVRLPRERPRPGRGQDHRQDQGDGGPRPAHRRLHRGLGRGGPDRGLGAWRSPTGSR